MEEEITPSADYIKGYNEGYIMNKYEPELAGDLAKAAGKSERGQGFKDGAHYNMPAKDKTYIPNFLQHDRLAKFNEPAQEKDRDLDRGRDE